MTKKEKKQFNVLTESIVGLEKKIQSLTIKIPNPEYHVENCANCGAPFVLNDVQYKNRFNGKSFYCASGHANVYKKV